MSKKSLCSLQCKITAKTTQRHPLFFLLFPLSFIQQRVQSGDGDFIDNFPASNQRDPVEQLKAMGAMRLAVFEIFEVAA
ncbi:Uncharacterised protein [Citrobacter freundii]|nr:Uncharacterised protein [Citrobacter freundii]